MVNNNIEVANEGADVVTSKVGDAIAVLFKILFVMFCMALSIVICFAICAKLDVPMGKTIFLCIMSFMVGGLAASELLNGGKY